MGQVIDATHVGRVKATEHLADGESAEFAIDYTGKPSAIEQQTCFLNPGLSTAELDADLRLGRPRVARALIRATKVVISFQSSEFDLPYRKEIKCTGL